MPPYLSAAELAAALALRDLSDPAQGPHAMQLVLGAVVDALVARWDVPALVIRDSPLVAVEDNYDRLGFAPDAVTRDRRYSRYVSPTVMLRSHTSASIPGVLRMTPHIDDRLLVVPGLVHRWDAVDRTHVGAPHHVDLWRLSSHPMDAEDLLEMAVTVVEAVLPGAEWRAVPSPHPYTVGGRQVDVRIGTEWLELAECGVIAERLLAECGHDPSTVGGLALGLGLDRALMLRKGLPDIRLLRAADQRIAEQLLDLSPWRPVSVMPPVRRDLSIVLAADTDAEVLGDGAREALGARVDDLESIELVAVTPARDLPSTARKRLRIAEGEVNALVRIVLRPLDRTLTDTEANRLRDDVYRALHQGPVAELIGEPG